jgi:hypothetical protein
LLAQQQIKQTPGMRQVNWPHAGQAQQRRRLLNDVKRGWAGELFPAVQSTVKVRQFLRSHSRGPARHFAGRRYALYGHDRQHYKKQEKPAPGNPGACQR